MWFGGGHAKTYRSNPARRGVSTLPYSRSNDYAEFFLEVWERAMIPGESEGKD